MSLHRAEIETIAKVMGRFLGKSLATNEVEVTRLITHILNQNLDTEEEIEKEAEALFKKHRQAGMDADKAVTLIKHQIAKQKKFAL